MRLDRYIPSGAVFVVHLNIIAFVCKKGTVDVLSNGIFVKIMDLRGLSLCRKTPSYIYLVANRGPFLS